MSVCSNVYMYMSGVSGTCRGHPRASDSLKLELWWFWIILSVVKMERVLYNSSSYSQSHLPSSRWWGLKVSPSLSQAYFLREQLVSTTFSAVGLPHLNCVDGEMSKFFTFSFPFEKKYRNKVLEYKIQFKWII